MGDPRYSRDMGHVGLGGGRYQPARLPSSHDPPARPRVASGAPIRDDLRKMEAGRRATHLKEVSQTTYINKQRGCTSLHKIDVGIEHERVLVRVPWKQLATSQRDNLNQ
jgi:hypothetical protein